MRNTQSNFKYFPVATEYMSLLHFMAIKHHCTKHTSHISRTFPLEPLTILHFPSNTKHFHCSQMCSYECQQTRFHLYFCLFHFSDNLQSHLPNAVVPHQSFPYQVLIISSNLLPFSSPNHILCFLLLMSSFLHTF